MYNHVYIYAHTCTCIDIYTHTQININTFGCDKPTGNRADAKRLLSRSYEADQVYFLYLYLYIYAYIDMCMHGHICTHTPNVLQHTAK